MTDAITIAATAPWREFFHIHTSGALEVHGQPTQADFEQALYDLCRVKDTLQRTIGNLLAYGERRWQADYITGLMEAMDRSRSALYQYKSVYARLPPEHQRPGIKYSYDRELARLPPEQQPAMLDKLEAGKFANSDELREAVRAQLREPPRSQAPPPRPIPCPICGENGWRRDKLHWSECPNQFCGAHGDEVLERFNDLLDAVQEFYTTGDRGPLDKFARLYKWITL